MSDIQTCSEMEEHKLNFNEVKILATKAWEDT